MQLLLEKGANQDFIDKKSNIKATNESGKSLIQEVFETKRLQVKRKRIATLRHPDILKLEDADTNQKDGHDESSKHLIEKEIISGKPPLN